LAQVLILLESQRAQAQAQPERWIYWQKRAGNEIGNQLYREGDYLGTLQIYERLAELDNTAAWQLPVWYQIGLVFERLQQPAKAMEIYSRLLARRPEVSGAHSTPSLNTLLEMTQWRRDNLTWFEKATATAAAIRHSPAPLAAANSDEATRGNP
jgi:tetratricopeptide (TPR) repeat protein